MDAYWAPHHSHQMPAAEHPLLDRSPHFRTNSVYPSGCPCYRGDSALARNTPGNSSLQKAPTCHMIQVKNHYVAPGAFDEAVTAVIHERHCKTGSQSYASQKKELTVNNLVSPPIERIRDRNVRDQGGVSEYTLPATKRSSVRPMSTQQSQQLFKEKPAVQLTEVSSRTNRSRLSTSRRTTGLSRGREKSTQRNEAPQANIVTNSRRNSLTRWYNEFSRNLEGRHRIHPLPSKPTKPSETELDCSNVSSCGLGSTPTSSLLQTARIPQVAVDRSVPGARPTVTAGNVFDATSQPNMRGNQVRPPLPLRSCISRGARSRTPSVVTKRVRFRLDSGYQEEEAVKATQTLIREQHVPVDFQDGKPAEPAKWGVAREAHIPGGFRRIATAEEVAMNVGQGARSGAPMLRCSLRMPETTLVSPMSRTAGSSSQYSTGAEICNDLFQANECTLSPPELETRYHHSGSGAFDNKTPWLATRRSGTRDSDAAGGMYGHQPQKEECVFLKPAVRTPRDTCEDMRGKQHQCAGVTWPTSNWVQRIFPNAADLLRYETSFDTYQQSLPGPSYLPPSPEKLTQHHELLPTPQTAAVFQHSMPNHLHVEQNVNAGPQDVEIETGSFATHRGTAAYLGPMRMPSTQFCPYGSRPLLTAGYTEGTFHPSHALQDQAFQEINDVAVYCGTDRVQVLPTDENRIYTTNLHGADRVRATASGASEEDFLDPHTVQLITTAGATTAAAAVGGTALVIGVPIAAAMLVAGAAAVATSAVATGVLNSDCPCVFLNCPRQRRRVQKCH